MDLLLRKERRRLEKQLINEQILQE